MMECRVQRVGFRVQGFIFLFQENAFRVSLYRDRALEGLEGFEVIFLVLRFVYSLQVQRLGAESQISP